MLSRMVDPERARSVESRLSYRSRRAVQNMPPSAPWAAAALLAGLGLAYVARRDYAAGRAMPSAALHDRERAP